MIVVATPRRPLTTREKSILDYIREKINLSGYPPTVREICAAVGLRSTSTVHGYLTRLEEMGYIKKDPASSRAIELTEDLEWKHKKIIPTPVIGSIHAGDPTLAEENVETILPLPAELIGDQDSFILTVRGDSMINAGIMDGDLLIVRRQNMAKSGDIVAAALDDEKDGCEATVKRYYQEADHIRLQPENDNYEPIITTKARILGVVVGLYRHY